MFWQGQRRFIAVAAALALTVTVGCARPDQQHQLRANATLVDEGRLTMCSSVNIEPFVFVRNGQHIGMNMDLGKLIGQELGVPTHVVEVSADEVDTGEALNTDLCDLVISPVTNNAAREALMDFSEPYYPANVGLVVRKDSQAKSFLDLKGKRMGVPGSTSMDAFGAARAAGIQLVQYERIGQEIEAVATGKVDAAVSSYPLILLYASKNDQLKPVQEIKTSEEYAIGIRKGNDKIVKAANDVLRRLKATGDIVPLQRKWFGDTLPIYNQ